MKRILLFLLLALPVFAQTHTEMTLEDNQTVTGQKTFSSVGLGASGYVSVQRTNSATGTTLNKLAKLVVSAGTTQAQVTTTSDINGVAGCVVAGAGTTGSATIATLGISNCFYDNVATTAGDFVTPSTLVGGVLTDAGSSFPANSTEVMGRVLDTHAPCGAPPCGPYPTLFLTPDTAGAGGGTTNSYDLHSYGAVADDSTDNAAAFTAWAAAVNAYTGSGVPTAFCNMNTGDKAFKTSGGANFLIPVTLVGHCTIDVAASFGGTVLDLGPTNVPNYTASSQVQPYTVSGFTFIGGAGGATAIKGEQYISELNIHDNNCDNFSTSAGWCVNLLGNNNELNIVNNWCWSFDTTNGRNCFRSVDTASANTGIISGNHALTANFNGSSYTYGGHPCGGTGFDLGGVQWEFIGNSVYGFNNNVRIEAQSSGDTLANNTMDDNSCQNGAVSSNIQLGKAGAGGSISNMAFANNQYVGGTLFDIAGDAVAPTITDLSVTNNLAIGGNYVTAMTNCLRCNVDGNFKNGTVSCSVTGAGTGATCTIFNNHASVGMAILVINTGTTPSSSGTLTYTVSNTGTSSFICTAQPHNFNANWNARASFIINGTAIWNWDNNAVNLTGSTSNAYAVDVICRQFI